MTQLKMTAFLGSLVLLFVAGFPLQAEEPINHSYIVLVGINEYQDPQIQPRKHAEADAKAFYDMFASKDYLGVDKDHIKLLLGKPDSQRGSEPATRENILKAFRWAASSALGNDLVVFAIIGEGAPLGERSCYFASDSTYKDRAKNAVAAAEVETALEKMKSHQFCIFLDVNFKGFNPGKEPAPDANLSGFYKEFLGANQDEHTLPKGRLLFLANTGLKQSLDLENHGIFSQVLLNGLQGAADRDGYEPDGLVTVDELMEYIGKELPNLARKYGKTHDEKDQRDFVMGGRSNHFAITHNPAAYPKMKERLEKFGKLASDDNLAKDLVEEGKNLLARMPKLEAYRKIRKDYQQLVDGKMSVAELTKARKKILDEMVINKDEAKEYASKVMSASELLKNEYVKKVNQGELIASAIKGLYLRIDETMPADVKKTLEGAKNLDDKELTELLVDVRERLGKREDLDNHKDLDFALQHMMTPLDPYTTYIDPETLAQFKRETQGNFTGIGVTIRVDPVKDMLTVISPIKGSPAYKKGLQAGDIITTITRLVDDRGKPLETPEVIPTKGLLISDAVKKIVGKPGTKVRLTIDREGVAKPIDIEINRGNVEVESVIGVKRKPDDSWDFVLDPESQICYVRLTSFARYTYRDLVKALDYLKSTSGIKGFILDLRFNPGGLLTSAVDISDMFIDDGLIVSIRPRVGRETAYTGKHEGSMLEFPMVCLVNGHSASGSEIVSACLQDHGRAVIMGERSYGKGSVQNIQPFEEGEIKLTTASFWRPSGKNLNRSSTTGKEGDEWGVTPDKGYLLKLSRKERDELEEFLHKSEIIVRKDAPAKDPPSEFKDRQLEMALKYLRGQIKIASSVSGKKAG